MGGEATEDPRLNEMRKLEREAKHHFDAADNLIKDAKYRESAGYSAQYKAQNLREAIAREELLAPILDALRKAEQFIVNGCEMGFIRMPDAGTPDPAHDTLPAIRSAIAKATGGAS